MACCAARVLILDSYTPCWVKLRGLLLNLAKTHQLPCGNQTWQWKMDEHCPFIDRFPIQYGDVL